MIDLSAETLIPLRGVPRHLPLRPNGKRLHVSAIYRWAQRGARGVVLETIRVGGTTYTSVEALQRFGERLSPVGLPAQSSAHPTPRTRVREIERANQLVRVELGIPDRSQDEPDVRPR